MQPSEQITQDMYHRLLAEAYSLCATANRVENVWFVHPHGEPVMRQDVDSMRKVLDEFSMVLYGKKYND